MSRRVSRSISAVIALTLILSAPSAFAGYAPPSDEPAGPIARIVRVVKKLVRGFQPSTYNDDVPGVIWPTPPKG